MAALGSSLISRRFGLARLLLFADLMLMMALLVYALATSWGLMVAAGTLLELGIGLIDAGINAYIVQEQRDAELMGWLHAFLRLLGRYVGLLKLCVFHSYPHPCFFILHPLFIAPYL